MFCRALSQQTHSFVSQASQAQHLPCFSPIGFVSLFHYGKVLQTGDEKKLGSLFL